ncbi:MAG TPA: hypothetical protein VKG78_10105 [Opitutaceae bacterium]|nr:hypothetical protein [Opitutaceae bacterium]
MGNFYTNFTILGVASEDVLDAARLLRRTAYVVQAPTGDSVMFDSACETQDVYEMERLGLALSGRLGAPVVACLNHDDDHLLLWVFRDEMKVAFYESCTDAPVFSWWLTRARGGVAAYPLVVGVLGWPFVVFQFLRHKALACLLSLPNSAVGFGYKYLSNGEIPSGYSKDEIHAA